MAHIGRTAARLNIFLDIPFFLRGLSQSLYGEIGPEISMGSKIIEQIHQVDPLDPTSIVDEYLYDWWKYEKEWETHPVEVNHVAAFSWHVKKVNENFIIGPPANTLSDRQYGSQRPNKQLSSEGAPPPQSVHVTCKSNACKDRLYSVLGEVQKCNQIIRTLMTAMEEDRVAAARHILHLKALKNYQLAKNKTTLSMSDVQKLYDEGIVIENPDVEMGEAGPSTADKSLTPQSLSFNGFSDSDSDYIP
jgi:hypothetical protein